MTASHCRALVVLLGLLAATTPSGAQIPGISAKPAAPVEAAGEKPDDTEARLQQWLKEARVAFAKVNEPGAGAGLPEGIDAAALDHYRRDLEQIILSINRHLKILAAMPDARKALEIAREAGAAWAGFSETPPYSVLMVDELVNQHEAIKKKAASFRSSVELYGRNVAAIQEEAKLAGEASRRIQAEAEQEPAGNGAAAWKLTADRARTRLIAVRGSLFQSNILLLQEQAETARLQLELLAKQIETAKKQAVFSDADLEKIKKSVGERQAALRKEIAAIHKRQPDATAARVRAQAALDPLLEAGGNDESLALARARLEAAETRVEALQTAVESLESMALLEGKSPEIYQIRRTLAEAKSAVERGPALADLRVIEDRLQTWGVVVTNDLAAVNADISKQESRAALITADDPLLATVTEQRAALWEKQAAIQRISQLISAQRRMLKRWIAEHDTLEAARPLTESIGVAAGSALGFARWLRDFEVFQYDDTVMIGGLPITEKRGVALGKILLAVLAFVVLYLVFSRVNRRLQGAVVRRGRIAEAQAKTLGNWLMILIGFLLALSTLHFLKIPLTVFAFLGGALAIGLGFGTQTLIKNFISGIIVLFERKIRVGDVVDIGGTAGSVVEINTRSSVVRGPDGRESLVPNSVFLENTVTNLTLSNRTVRRAIQVGVAYGSTPSQVISILTECADRHGLVVKDPAPIVIFMDFGDNALLFRLYVWLALEGKNNPEIVESDLRLMVEKRFGEVGIAFPFPQRDIHLRSDAPLQVTLSPTDN